MMKAFDLKTKNYNLYERAMQLEVADVAERLKEQQSSIQDKKKLSCN